MWSIHVYLCNWWTSAKLKEMCTAILVILRLERVVTPSFPSARRGSVAWRDVAVMSTRNNKFNIDLKCLALPSLRIYRVNHLCVQERLKRLQQRKCASPFLQMLSVARRCKLQTGGRLCQLSCARNLIFSRHGISVSSIGLALAFSSISMRRKKKKKQRHFVPFIPALCRIQGTFW